MLTLIYRRDPLGFTLVCIAAYVLAMGLGNGLSERLGAAYSGNALLAALFIAALLGWSGKGGLRRPQGCWRRSSSGGSCSARLCRGGRGVRCGSRRWRLGWYMR